MTSQMQLPTINSDSQNGLTQYFSYINAQKLLTEQEEQVLFQRFHEDNDLQAARELILSHLRFVAYIAKSYLGYGLPLEDLIQEGNVGLMKSVKKFDAGYGVRLASFAAHWIKAEIHEYVIKNWKLVKVATTKAQRKLFFNLRKIKQHLGRIGHKEAQSIATEMKVKVADVLEMDQRLSEHDFYFDSSFGEDRPEDFEQGYALANLLQDSTTNPEQKVSQQQSLKLNNQGLISALKSLDPRARDIIERRYLCDEAQKSNLKSLAVEYGISEERVRQIEHASLQKLKKRMSTAG